jgi:hypothetical protein
MRVMNEVLTVGLGPSTSIRSGMQGASGPLGLYALVYLDDCWIHPPALEQHLLYVAVVLELFRRRKLFAKISKGEFGRQELGFLGHCISKEGVSVDPHKVQSIDARRRRPRAWSCCASLAWITTTASSWRATVRLLRL